MDRYSFSFATHDGEPVDVHIYDTESTTERVTQLIPTASPLTITMQTSDNALEPVRYTSAKINVLCKAGEVLDLTGNRRYLVRVVKDDENIFTGFLRAEAYTQEYSSVEDSFTYNAVDYLGASEGIKLNESTTSMADVIRLIANTSYNTTSNLYVGNSLPCGDDAKVTTTLNLRTRQENWRQDDDDLRELTYASVLEYVKEWCTFFGVTAYCNGEDIYIGSPDDTGFYFIGVLSDIAHGPLGEIYRQMGSSTFADITPTGKHTIDYKQPAQKVEMTFGGKDYSGEHIPELSKESTKVKWFGTLNAYNFSNKDFPWFVILQEGDKDKGTDIFLRHIDENGYTSEVVPQVNRCSAGFSTTAAGAAYIRHDYWDTGEEDDKGSGTALDKHNYDLKDTLIIWGEDPKTHKGIRWAGEETELREDAIAQAKAELHRRTQYPLVILSSTKPVVFGSDGGLCISFSASAYIEKLPLNRTVPTYSGKLSLICELSVGNNYWNGSQWTEVRSRFLVDFDHSSKRWNDGDPVTNTKKLVEENYKCDGYSINLKDVKLSGAMKFIIYGVAKDTAYRGERPRDWWYPAVEAPACTKIRELSIQYCEPFDKEYKDEDIETTHKMYETRDGGMDTQEQSTSLSSGFRVAENTGIIEGTSSMKNIAKATNGSAEELTFDRLKRMNFAVGKRVTLSANEGIPIPTSIYQHGAESYRVECATDWKVIEGTAKLKLRKI